MLQPVCLFIFWGGGGAVVCCNSSFSHPPSTSALVTWQPHSDNKTLGCQGSLLLIVVSFEAISEL